VLWARVQSAEGAKSASVQYISYLISHWTQSRVGQREGLAGEERQRVAGASELARGRALCPWRPCDTHPLAALLLRSRANG